MELVPTALEDWPTAAGTAQGVRTEIAVFGDPKNPNHNTVLDDRLSAAMPCRILPMAALAAAHVGDMKMSDALIGQTPRDCYYAVRVRGELATIDRHWSDAARWFAEAVADAPSIPFAYAEWGRMLMAKGDLDGMISDATKAIGSALGGKNHAVALRVLRDGTIAFVGVTVGDQAG